MTKKEKRSPDTDPVWRPLMDLDSVAGIREPSHGTTFYFLGHWAATEDGPVCVGLEVWKDVLPNDLHTEIEPLREPIVGLKATDLRTINFGSVLRELWSYTHEEAAEQHAIASDVLERVRESENFNHELLQSLIDSFASFRDRPTARANWNDRRHFERVASVYEAAVRAGARNPTQKVQEAFGCSFSTATKWVSHAERKFNLLGSPRPGYARPVRIADEETR